MISYESAMRKAADETLALDEAQHFLALATEIRRGLQWRLGLQMTQREAVGVGIADDVVAGLDIEAMRAKADAEHDPSGDAIDLEPYRQRIGDAQTETMPLVPPVRPQVVDAVTERMTFSVGDRSCMHCGMAIYHVEVTNPGVSDPWLHRLSNQRACYQRNTMAWPAAVDLR